MMKKLFVFIAAVVVVFAAKSINVYAQYNFSTEEDTTTINALATNAFGQGMGIAHDNWSASQIKIANENLANAKRTFHDAMGLGADKATRTRFANNLKNAREYQKNTQALTGRTGNIMKWGGKAIGAAGLFMDTTDLTGNPITGSSSDYANDSSKHDSYFLRLQGRYIKYLKVGYGAVGLVNPGAEGAASVSSLAGSMHESQINVDFWNSIKHGKGLATDLLNELDKMAEMQDDVVATGWRYLFRALGIFGWGDVQGSLSLWTAIKPNIYLYPNETTLVDVKFSEPELLLTVIPDYKKHWQAIASPNGRLNVEGEDYGFLFYESSTTGQFMQFDEAFVVPGDNKVEFFTRICNLYNFNQQETKDFVEFWCDRLDEKTEYIMYPQITKIIDKEMPVDIYPKADSVFRIWFVYEAIDKDNKDKLTTIKTPVVTETVVRNGFTVVEWGGIVI